MNLFVKISFLVPTYNDFLVAHTVIELQDSARELLLEKKIEDFEVVISDDFSVSREHLSQVDLLDGRTRLILQEKNLGIVGNFRALYSKACFDIVAIVPGDGEWPPKEICRLICELDGQLKNSLVLTVRSTRFPNYSNSRVIVSFLYNLFATLVARKLILDLGSIKIFPKSLVTNTRTNSLLSEYEILLHARKSGLKIVNYKIHNIPRLAGKSSISVFNLMGNCLLDLYRITITLMNCEKVRAFRYNKK